MEHLRAQWTKVASAKVDLRKPYQWFEMGFGASWANDLTSGSPTRYLMHIEGCPRLKVDSPNTHADGEPRSILESYFRPGPDWCKKCLGEAQGNAGRTGSAADSRSDCASVAISILAGISLGEAQAIVGSGRVTTSEAVRALNSFGVCRPVRPGSWWERPLADFLAARPGWTGYLSVVSFMDQGGGSRVQTTAHAVAVVDGTPHNLMSESFGTPLVQEAFTFTVGRTAASGAQIEAWVDPGYELARGGFSSSANAVARVGGQAIGFLYVDCVDRTGEVVKVWVDPDHRRKGIATEMLRAVERALGFKVSHGHELSQSGAAWASGESGRTYRPTYRGEGEFGYMIDQFDRLSPSKRTASMKDTAYRGVSLPLSDRQGVPILEALVKRQTNVAARLIIDAMAETVKNHWWAAGAQESDEAGRWWTSRKTEAEIYAMGTTDAWMTLAVVMTATFEDAKGQGYNDGTYVWHLPAGHPVTITEFEALLPDDPQHLLDAWRGVISEGNYDTPGTYWDGTWTKLNVPQMRTTAMSERWCRTASLQLGSRDGFTVTDDLRTIVNELRHNVHSGEDLI